MFSSLLITRPRYDDGTHYLYHWAALLKENAQNRGLKVVDLEKKKADKKRVQSYMRKNICELVILNGHGNDTSVCGHNDEVLISTTDGLKLLKDKVLFVRACNAGLVLGREAMKEGCKAFIGYLQPYMFFHDPESLHKPLEDELAKPVLECSNQIGLSLIKGRSPAEAHADSLRKYQQKIDALSVSGAKSTYILPLLYWNMSAQVCYS